MIVEQASYVVAGATGHVGSVVADRLLRHGKRVRVIVRDAAKGSRWADRGAEVATGNLGDADFVAEALVGASGFFTLMPPDYAAPDIFAAQRRYADSIAGAVAAGSVPHVVLLSSLGAELPSGTGPIKGLHYFENKLRETGTTLTAIRAAYFQENAAMGLEPARTMGIFAVFGDRDDERIPMIATRDIGELAASALLDPPAASEVVDLVGPEYAWRDVAAALGKVLGKPLQIVKIPRSEWAPTLRQAGIPPAAAETMAEMFGALGSGIVRPKGDRLVKGDTTLDETVRTLGA
jgi:uncharacterized protein YbjT (DUF2867 family)